MGRLITFFTLSFFLSSCGENYHLTGAGQGSIASGKPASVSLILPERVAASQSYNLEGTCLPDNATVKISSDDMSPSSLSCPCQGGQYLCATSVVFSGLGPNGGSPLVKAQVTENGKSATADGATYFEEPLISVQAPSYDGSDISGGYNINLSFEDTQGGAIPSNGVNKATITLQEPGGAIFFSGDFLIGDDLSSSAPIQTHSGSWSSVDYFSGGSEIRDGGVLNFKKREWAESEGHFYELFDPSDNSELNSSPESAIDLEVIVQITDPGGQSNTESVVIPKRYRLVWDQQHDITSIPPSMPNFTFPIVNVAGGVIYSTTLSLPYVRAINKCGGTLNLYNWHATGGVTDPMRTVTHLEIEGGGLNPITPVTSGTHWWNSLAAALGSGSTNTSDYGTDCTHRVDTLSILNEHVEINYTSARLTPLVGSEHMIVETKVFSSY